MNQTPTPPLSPPEMYEKYFVPAMFIPWARLLLARAAPQPGERVLDVACGTGIVARMAAPLVGAGGQVVAVDFNPPMLGVARSLPAPAGAAIRWEEGNAMALPFADGSFDLVLCQHGLQFFPDRALAVCEMRRVLKPGGRALVIVLQQLALHPVFQALIESVARQLALPVADVMTPFALSDAGQLKGLFTNAGFAKVEVLAESATVRFPEPERFVPLAVMSSAAAVPAFAQLQGPARATLLEAVRQDIAPLLQSTIRDGELAFTMHAHIAVGV